MNQIKKYSIESLGYQFIPEEYIPKGKDEYYLRNIQNRSGINYRKLSAIEIEALVKNRNTSDDWNMILVSEDFNPELVKNCQFYGLIRIGKLEPLFLEFSNLKVAVGLYNSTIISSDIGDNCVVYNVKYLSHYILGNEVILSNLNEIQTTGNAKFGNGILKDGENENLRIHLEVCNENGGRKILPFNSMLAGDAWMWAKFRNEQLLLDKFVAFTESEFKTARGYYGKIGDRSVIKNSNVIKDVWIGTDAYIKGANKLKNLTINSGEEGRTQIGEGCELVNGCIGFGCRIFYGSKAVRFIMASHSQLKYGARLINSYLGNNATISCCEVLNSLIFPGHEQHHNNSFLCAALIMGQSNIPAGASIGSNHNSRGADGEIVAGRGFWPALAVSLKHNSKFTSYTMLAKGDYDHELNIKIPFSLVSLQTHENELQIMPGYWFMYNMYALVRNSQKYYDRDKRKIRIQHFTYEYLAPDTIDELFDALPLLEIAVGKAALVNQNKNTNDSEYQKIGKNLLTSNLDEVDKLDIYINGFENSKRKTKLIKVGKAYHVFKKMIKYYGLIALYNNLKINNSINFKKKYKREPFLNLGGQLIPSKKVNQLKQDILNDKINNWDQVHDFYFKMGENYTKDQTQHAFAALEEINNFNLNSLSPIQIKDLLNELLEIQEWILNQIQVSRAKDYQNAFRKMVYDHPDEMDAVIGKLEDNSFIASEKKHLDNLKKNIYAIKKSLN